MNGTRSNRRLHEYRGGQRNREISKAERNEFLSQDYSVTKGGYRDLKRVLSFKETGVPYTKNYIQNKEAFDDLRKARFETKMCLWPRDKNGMRLKWADLQTEECPSGDAKSAAEAVKLNMFYPHQNYAGGLFCSAPFSKGEKSFLFESAAFDPNKNLVASLALAVGEVRFKIMQYLSYNDIGALQGTCTLVANLIMGTPALWDMSNGKCNYSEFTEDEFELLKKSEDVEPGEKQGNNPFIMISPTHMKYSEKMYLRLLPWNVAKVRGVLCVGRSLQLRGETIKRVCFNRVDFFDGTVFATYLDMMPNLERADITGCDLIRYHHVPTLLKVIEAHNTRYGDKLLFDIAPKYNTGALWENAAAKDREGTYGLTYSNPGVRIPTAVCKLYIYDIAPLLKKTGQTHMMEHNALFRRFLEKLPLHSKTVPRMEAVAEHKDYLKRLFAKGNISENQKAKLQIRCTFAELVTIFGKEGWIQLYEDGARSTSQQGTAASYGVWGDTAECNECRTEVPLMYCSTGYVCDSCQMITAVNNEDYHYKLLRMRGTTYFGCGHPNGDMLPLEETNIDFSILRNEDGTPRIKRFADFERILSREVPDLKRLFNHAHHMDLNGNAGLRVHDLCFQKKHEYDRGARITDTQRDLLRLTYYRKALPLEEIQKLPKGRVYNEVGQF